MRGDKSLERCDLNRLQVVSAEGLQRNEERRSFDADLGVNAQVVHAALRRGVENTCENTLDLRSHELQKIVVHVPLQSAQIRDESTRAVDKSAQTFQKRCASEPVAKRRFMALKAPSRASVPGACSCGKEGRSIGNLKH